MNGMTQISVDVARGALQLAGRTLALWPTGQRACWRLATGEYVRAITFAERSHAVREAIVADDPSAALLARVRELALFGPASALVDSVLLALAGAAEDAPAFETCAVAAARLRGWRWLTLQGTLAIEVDRAAPVAADAADAGWTRFVFAQPSAAEATAAVHQNLGLDEPYEPGAPELGLDADEPLCVLRDALCQRLLARACADAEPPLVDPFHHTGTASRARAQLARGHAGAASTAGDRADGEAGWLVRPREPSAAAAARSALPRAAAGAAVVVMPRSAARAASAPGAAADRQPPRQEQPPGLAGARALAEPGASAAPLALVARAQGSQEGVNSAAPSRPHAQPRLRSKSPAALARETPPTRASAARPVLADARPREAAPARAVPTAAARGAIALAAVGGVQPTAMRASAGEAAPQHSALRDAVRPDTVAAQTSGAGASRPEPVGAAQQAAEVLEDLALSLSRECDLRGLDP